MKVFLAESDLNPVVIEWSDTHQQSMSFERASELYKSLRETFELAAKEGRIEIGDGKRRIGLFNSEVI